jgi:hypothetical protein
VHWGQQLPARHAFTSDLRKAVTSRVNDTGFPPAGHGMPFICTRETPSTLNSQPYQPIYGNP